VSARILVVDDDPIIGRVVQMNLSPEGYEVTVVSSATAALAQVASRRPDCILLDVMMPEIDGLEVCQRLKAREETAAIPIIMLTARAQVEDKLAAFRLGADDYISKPFDVYELSARVRVALSRASYATLANDNARLLEQAVARQQEAETNLRRTERQARIFRSLYELAVATNGVLDTSQLWHLATDKACQLLEAGGAGLVWWDEARHRLSFPVTNTPEGDGRPLSHEAREAAALAFNRSEAVVVNGEGPLLPGPAGVETNASRGGVIAVPLMVSDRTLGALVVCDLASRQVETEQVEILQLLAGLVTPMLEAAQLHTRLRESDARNSAIVESALDAMILVDPEFRIIEFNPAAERTFGHRREDTLGRSALELLVPARMRAGLEPSVWPIGVGMESVALRADGSEFPIEISIGAVEDGGGPMLVASIRDLSDRKRAETARLKSEAQTRFLATMSHELRTPLNSILGFTQLMESEDFGPLNERQRRYIAHIAFSGQHLLNLINDLLDISKVQAGQAEIHIEEVSLSVLLNEAVENVAPLAGATNLTLVVNASEGLRVKADRRRVLQIALNLLSNAIKFTPSGGHISIGARRSGNHVLIEVIDNGVGIPPDQHERIFEEFTQVESDRTRSQPGTGLGLALCKTLTLLMGGSISVSSQPGVGSTFTVTLPRQPSVSKPLQALDPIQKAV
jgi:PAS domain S-box-containing protein